MAGQFFVFVDAKLYTMFVLDEFACTVDSDIIDHTRDRLDAADAKLTELGFSRTGTWEKNGSGTHWIAEARRVRVGQQDG